MRARALLIQAVQALAVGPYDIRYRLWDAYYYFSQIRAGDLPEWLEEDFAWVMKTIFERVKKTRCGKSDSGKISEHANNDMCQNCQTHFLHHRKASHDL